MNNKLHFDGQVALVTGAGRGLGREYALLLAQRGARVVVNDLGLAGQVVDEIRTAGGEAVANESSVVDAEATDAMVEQALSTWGQLDIIVNNAGIGGGTLSPPDVTERVLATHFLGTANVLRSARPVMESSGYGRIVNTSSGSFFGIRGTGDYAAAKGAILALSRVLANEYRARPDSDIKVNVIMPAAQTPLMPVASDATFAAMMDDVFAPWRVAAFVALLCHRDAPCNGETFLVGGGRASRVLFQSTAGYVDGDPTPEGYLEHFADVMAGADARENTEGTLADILSRGGQTSVSIVDVK